MREKLEENGQDWENLLLMAFICWDHTEIDIGKKGPRYNYVCLRKTKNQLLFS